MRSMPAPAARRGLGSTCATAQGAPSHCHCMLLCYLVPFPCVVQMIPVGNEATAACTNGACATDRNQSSAVPRLNSQEEADARSQGQRLAQLAASLRGMRRL